MKLAVLTVVVAASLVFGGSAVLERPLPVGSTALEYQYDDGSAYWLTWVGDYRGTWFHFADFGASGPRSMGQLEFWFYHHSSYPWDTTSFYAELWSGDGGLPLTMLEQVSTQALHYAPKYVTTSPHTLVSGCWILVNTTLSSGGWPSILGDNTPQPSYSHSYYSDNLINWTPYVVSGPLANDYFIRCAPLLALDSESWGAIKALYQ